MSLYQCIYRLKDDKLTALSENLWTNCIIKTGYGLLFGTKEDILNEQMDTQDGALIVGDGKTIPKVTAK